LKNQLMNWFYSFINSAKILYELILSSISYAYVVTINSFRLKSLMNRLIFLSIFSLSPIKVHAVKLSTALLICGWLIRADISPGFDNPTLVLVTKFTIILKNEVEMNCAFSVVSAAITFTQAIK